jgi:hypothetical protein
MAIDLSRASAFRQCRRYSANSAETNGEIEKENWRPIPPFSISLKGGGIENLRKRRQNAISALGDIGGLEFRGLTQYIGGGRITSWRLSFYPSSAQIRFLNFVQKDKSRNKNARGHGGVTFPTSGAEVKISWGFLADTVAHPKRTRPQFYSRGLADATQSNSD